MAFVRPKKPPQFADLKSVLAQSKETDNPLYQVVAQLLDRLTQLDLTTGDEVRATRETVEAIIAKPPVTPPTPGEEEGHAETHEAVGSDPVTVTTLAGYPGGVTTFLRADGTFSLPTGATPGPHAGTHNTGGSDPITTIAESVITDGTILARVASAETITQSWTFNGFLTTIAQTIAQLFMIATGAPANQGRWDIKVDNTTFSITTLDDTSSNPDVALMITRSGRTVTQFQVRTSDNARTQWDNTGKMTHFGGFYLPASVDIAVTSDQTAWNPPGFGTVFIYNMAPAAGNAIRGMLAQSDGYIFMASNGYGAPFTFTHEDAAASPANRINTPGGVSFTIFDGRTATFFYDATVNRWKVIAKT